MMFADDDDDDDWNNQNNEEDDDDDNQPQGYQALLDPDDDNDETSIIDDEDEEIEDIEGQKDDEEPSADDNEIKSFSCKLCSIAFSKFEAYREHFVSTEHRYKRRDEKRRLPDGSIIETSSVEIFVNLLLYNKIPFESIQFDIQSIEFSVNGSFEYNNIKYEHQHASSINELYQILVDKFNCDYEKHKLKMPPQSFFVARDICRKEADNIWTIPRYCDDTGKSIEQITKEVLDYCVYANVEPERERLIAHSIQTWRMFHRQETKAGFWCDICKQCFRKRKAIISHFETSEKHENNLKHLPPYRRAVQHSLFTGRSLHEFVPMDQLNYYRNRVNAYRIPPSNKTIKNAYYCTFCKKSFESSYSLERHLGWKAHRDLIRKRRQNELDNLLRLVTYLNFNQLSHEQRQGGIQQMPKTPDEYRLKYNLEPLTIESIRDDILRFDTQLAQQVMQNINTQQGNYNQFKRGNFKNRGQRRGNQAFRGQTFRPRANFHQQTRPNFNTGQYHHPANYQVRPYNHNQMNQFQSYNSFRPQNHNFTNPHNKRPYPMNHHNNNYYNPRQQWPNKRARFERPLPQQQTPSSSGSVPNRIDFRYVANPNAYQHEQQFP